MRFYEDVFLGVKTYDMKLARKLCEELIGVPLKCTSSTFHGGEHCHADLLDSSYDLRLNHFDDGDGYRWCIDDPQYPLVLTCSFRSPETKQGILGRLQQFPLMEMPEENR